MILQSPDEFWYLLDKSFKQVIHKLSEYVVFRVNAYHFNSLRKCFGNVFKCAKNLVLVIQVL